MPSQGDVRTDDIRNCPDEGRPVNAADIHEFHLCGQNPKASASMNECTPPHWTVPETVHLLTVGLYDFLWWLPRSEL